MSVPLLVANFAFIIILISLGVQSQNIDCSTVRCANIQSCPLGEYLIPSSPENGVCCSYCQKYASLGEDCNYDYPKSKYCSNVLSCQSPTPDSPQTCTYSWISYINQNCSRPGCPTYCSCPDDQFLIKADNTTRCCDLCINYSNLGDYCDENQQCSGNLRCINKVCKPSDTCSKEQCPHVTSCKRGKYLVTKDGDQICCDYCKPYAEEGEYCDDFQQCDEGFTCDYGNQKCVKLECNRLFCPRIVLFCGDDGYILPADGVKRCCSSCRKYATCGQYCDDEYKCGPSYECKNNKCAAKCDNPSDDGSCTE